MYLYFSLDIRTKVYENISVNGNELFKKLKKLARERDLRIELVKEHGKGSHGTLYFGDKRTTLKDLKKEIGPGLLKAMLKKLGLKREDIG